MEEPAMYKTCDLCKSRGLGVSIPFIISEVKRSWEQFNGWSTITRGMELEPIGETEAFVCKKCIRKHRLGVSFALLVVFVALFGSVTCVFIFPSGSELQIFLGLIPAGGSLVAMLFGINPISWYDDFKGAAGDLATLAKNREYARKGKKYVVSFKR